MKRNYQKKHSAFADPILNNASKEKDGKWIVNIEKYKDDYFEECFEDGTDEMKLCHEYLEGMQWVLSYYTRGVPNWKMEL